MPSCRVHAGSLSFGASFFSDLDLELLLGHIDHLIVEICTQSGLLELLLKPPDLLFQRLGRHALAASLRSMDAGHSLGGNLLLHR